MLVHRPAIYEHAVALIERTVGEAQLDAELLYQAHRAAWRRYGLDHLVVALDIYGADAAAWSQAAGSAPGDLPDLADAPPREFPAGPQRTTLTAAARLRGELPDSVQVRVPVTGPMSLAAQLVGFETLLVGLLDSRQVAADALDRLADAQERLVRAAGRAGCGVTVFESAASPPLVRPEDFAGLVQPRLARLMAAARETCPGPAELVLGGHTEPIYPMLLELKPALLIADPANDAGRCLAMSRAAGIELRVNLEPNLRLPEHRVAAHQRLEALARLARGSAPLYVATGVVPYDADPATVLEFTELLEQVNQAV